MKKFKPISFAILFIAFFIAFLGILCACQKDESIINDPTESPEESYLKVEDICGVWVNPQNSMYYLAIYPNGRYTFCLSDDLIGSGSYSLDENTLILNDGYFYTSDNVNISLNHEYLSITGDINSINNTTKYVNYKLKYSPSEELSPSIAGRSETGKSTTSVNYSEVINELNFVSDYVFTYKSTGKSKSTGSWKTLVNDTRYYVYRMPYTYCYKLNNSQKTLEIFDFNFLYKDGLVSLGFSIEGFRVK